MKKPESQSDIVLMGAGVMSATLGIMLKELQPDCTIQIFERLDTPGLESSDAWNNAGTGHAAFCELNYTPEKSGQVDCSKAMKIGEAFETSREFWSYLTERGIIADPSSFIHALPHLSLVWGEDNVRFLKERHRRMTASPLFSDMDFTENRDEIAGWAPITMEGRPNGMPLAATRMLPGTDVDFGALTRVLIGYLAAQPGVSVHYETEALDLDPAKKGGWDVSVKHLPTGEKSTTHTRFVFIGAGGATLHLLKRAEIRERKGYGGFPVGGLWLKCLNRSLIEKHHAKVYGKATVGSPPMSVPHIDTRFINGRKELLFGPFAAFSTKFLKNGSMLDLPRSIRPDNALPMIFAGLNNIPLTRYLIQQLRLSPEDRLKELREYVPTAELQDWQLMEAGQRVQVIKKHEEEGGVLEFGTEMVVAVDGSVAALLGASPGASTAASVMLNLLPRCFPDQWKSTQWQEKVREMAPSLTLSLAQDAQALAASRKRTTAILGLTD